MDPTTPAAGLTPNQTLLLGVLGALVTAIVAIVPALINRSGKSQATPIVVDSNTLLNELGGHDDALRTMDRELARQREETERLRADLARLNEELDLWQQRAYLAGWRPDP